MTDRLFALLHFIVVRFVLLLLASAAVGCWRAADSGGGGGNAGALHSAEATWAAAKPSCSAYRAGP